MNSNKIILVIGVITLIVGVIKLVLGDPFMEYFWGLFIGATLIGSYYTDFPEKFKK